jgi:hypothetical protein
MWIYLGKKIAGSWITTSPVIEDPTEYNKAGVNWSQDNGAIYIMSTYWVITTLTTVGYGDFKGYTP